MFIMKKRIFAILTMAAFLIGAVAAAGCAKTSSADNSCAILYDAAATADELIARIDSEKPNAVIMTSAQGEALGARVLEYLRDGTCFRLVYLDCSNQQVIGFTGVETGYSLGGGGEIPLATTLGYSDSMADGDSKGFHIGDYVIAAVEDNAGNRVELPEMSAEQRIENVKSLIQSDWEDYSKSEL